MQSEMIEGGGRSKCGDASWKAATGRSPCDSSEDMETVKLRRAYREDEEALETLTRTMKL